jgi:hypothetical protein
VGRAAIGRDRCDGGRVRREYPAQARATDQLHREIAIPVVLSHLVDRHDVGMVEPGDRLDLVLEPPQLRLASERTRPNTSLIRNPANNVSPPLLLSSPTYRGEGLFLTRRYAGIV